MYRSIIAMDVRPGPQEAEIPDVAVHGTKWVGTKVPEGAVLQVIGRDDVLELEIFFGQAPGNVGPWTVYGFNAESGRWYRAELVEVEE